MKKIILIIFCFTLPLLVHAQKEIGTTTIYPRLGLNSSKFTNDGIVDGQMEEYYSSKYSTSFTGGLELQRKRLGITVFQSRLKVRTFARTNSYEYGKQRQVQESA